jgi:hypothetical protein
MTPVFTPPETRIGNERTTTTPPPLIVVWLVRSVKRLPSQNGGTALAPFDLDRAQTGRRFSLSTRYHRAQKVLIRLSQ